MSATLKHSSLGEIRGNSVDGVVQFKGLKYATLKNRLASAELVEGYGTQATDATKFGPPPVSPIGAINNEFGFIQKKLPIPDVPHHSDLEGLNLNITIPSNENGEIDPNANLPVYVFIHGGGFAVGSSWYPHYDPAPLVRLSVEKKKPMIGVTINYRLGAPGFLTSEELRKAGYKANNGLRDQRVALRWVKKFIGGFGGNADEVTTVGESAGGLSVTMLLCSEEPLMKRCLSTGGAILLFAPIPQEATEAAYQQVIDALGLKDKSPEERIEALLKVPVDDLWQKVPPGAPLLPSVDGDIVPGTPTFKIVSSKEDSPEFPMPGRKWCKALMIGESKLDANILAYMALDARKSNIAQAFIDSANKTLASHPEAAKQLISAFEITPETKDDDAVLSILRFASEIAFYAPARATAQGWPNTPENKFFLYHFNEGIPWEGRFQGEPGHILDVAYLFQNYNEHLGDEQLKVARAYGEDFIKFVNGEDPWPAVQDGKFSARVYGPSSEGNTCRWSGEGLPGHVGRDERVLKLGESVGYDNVLAVFQNFLQGR
ncbi:carboxylesteras-like protein [Plenodomus tracheiphilus IPT5]|uniref:Carboxylesteras-like protein n=1 Tax=Plenodomus tracheiphilus IPT5 TaxID=1408161 RepID=A0A6A7AZJ5_9PLEO|nr:carboxylesteras-like protein [Plenodomus tracheiphilus IPT5]